MTKTSKSKTMRKRYSMACQAEALQLAEKEQELAYLGKAAAYFAKQQK